MDEMYVRKDVFEEIMKRMEAQNAASEARYQSMVERQEHQIAEFRAESEAFKQTMRAEIAEIRGDVKALTQQVDGLGDTIVAYVSGFSSRGSFWQWVLGAIIGLSAIIVAGVQVYLALK